MSDCTVEPEIIIEDETLLEVESQADEVCISVLSEETIEAESCVPCTTEIIPEDEVLIQLENDEHESEIFIESGEAVVLAEEQILMGPKGNKGDPGEDGEKGDKGDPGPPGGFEIIPASLVANVWTLIPLAIIAYVVDVVVYDQTNREKVEIDVKINLNQTVEVRSKFSKTYNIHVSGV